LTNVTISQKYISHIVFLLQMKKITLQNNILLFKPDYIINSYGFTISYLEKNLKIHYQADFKFHKQQWENERVYSVNRGEIFVNNQKPDMSLFEIASKMAKSVYPIIFRVNKDNELTSIENYEDIRNRCNITIRELSDYYDGKVANNIINCFKNQYSNSSTLINQLQRDLFFELLFFPLHKEYTSKLTAETKCTFCFGSNKPIPFQLLHQINPEYTSSGKVIVNLTSIGQTDENDIANTNMFEATYILYPEDHSIMSVTGKSIITNYKNIPETIEFELYHLNAAQRNTKKNSLLLDATERTLNFNEKRGKIYIGEAEELPKRKGFWSFLD